MDQVNMMQINLEARYRLQFRKNISKYGR